MGKSTWLFGGIFGGLGLIFALIGFGWIISNASFESSAEQTKGTVIEIMRMHDSDGVQYKPIVQFRDGSGIQREFTSSVSTSWQAYHKGETVDVLYDPENSNEALIDSSAERYFLPGIFAGVGSLFAAIGGGFIFWRVRRIQTVVKLFRDGQRIEADFVSCELDTSVRINGRSPFRVSAQAKHPATGMLASFLSDPIWLNLSEELRGKKIPVLIDPSDPDAQYVDLTEWVHEDEFV